VRAITRGKEDNRDIPRVDRASKRILKIRESAPLIAFASFVERTREAGHRARIVLSPEQSSGNVIREVMETNERTNGIERFIDPKAITT